MIKFYTTIPLFLIDPLQLPAKKSKNAKKLEKLSKLNILKKQF